MANVATLETFDPLANVCFPQPSDRFFHPRTRDEAENVRSSLSRLPDGTRVLARGRDPDHNGGWLPWDSAIGTKLGVRLYLTYASGDPGESHRIIDIDLNERVHFVVDRSQSSPINPESETATPLPLSNPLTRTQARNVVVLSHGYSPDVGPHYPVIDTMEAHAAERGWRVIKPDFRPTYAWTGGRDRAERIRMVLEALLVDVGENGPPDKLILAGHSQGGAVSAQVCTDAVVQGLGVDGLFLAASESPIELDHMNWVPQLPPDKIVIVHSDGDGVIPHMHMDQVAQAWGVRFHKVQSDVPHHIRDDWGDDIHHDFAAEPLMAAAMQAFDGLLEHA